MQRKYTRFLSSATVILSLIGSFETIRASDLEEPSQSSSSRQIHGSASSSIINSISLESISENDTINDESIASFAHLLGGPFPSWTSRITFLLKTGLRGWDSAVRAGIPHYQATVFSGSLGKSSPATFEEGRLWARNVLEGLQNTGLMRSWRGDRSLLIVGHEFAPNGDLDASGIRREYNASNPIPVEAYVGIRAEVSEWLKDKPKGIGFILGGCAVDTGKTITDDYGKSLKIGENRGFIAFSGDTEIGEFSKRSRDRVDGWTDAYAVPEKGSGYIEVPADKLVPGSQDTIGISICKDAAKIEAFPMRAALVVIPGAGVPHSDTIAPANAAAARLIADITQIGGDSETEPYLDGRSGLYELRGQGPIARLFYAGMNFLSVSPGQAQTSLLRYIKAGQHRFIFGGKGVLLVTKPRPFPRIMTERSLTENEKEMIEKQSPISDPNGDPTVSEIAEDPVEDNLKSDFRENQGAERVEREREALEAFGRKSEERRAL